MPRSIQRSKREPSFHSFSCATALLLLFSALVILSRPARSADNASQNSYGGRKVLVRVEPDYPSDLRVAGIGGYVHLNVTISPSGTVVSSEVIGGNPILAEAAKKAVTKWKFSPAATITSAAIWFHFGR
jgi:TonB family protein